MESPSPRTLLRPDTARDANLTLKILCRTNELSETLLTNFHRDVFRRHFGRWPPRWSAQIGDEFVVHGVDIIKGCPFYWVRIPERHHPLSKPFRWERYPGVCFDCLDDRPSRHWRMRTTIQRDGADQYFRTRLMIPSFFDEDAFMYRLLCGEDREYEIMSRGGDLMDAEFE